MTLDKLIRKLTEIKNTELKGKGDVEVLVLKNYPDDSLYYFDITSDYKTIFNVRNICDVGALDRLDDDISILIG